MADKTSVVMVSSTVMDLSQHRQEVLNACLSQGMFPKMMEHLPAGNDGGLKASLRMVDEADLYLAIIGHRYGHVPKGKTKSITHYEYERAARRGIPRHIFIMDENHPLTKGDVETGDGAEKLERFKALLKRKHTVNFFNSPSELRGQVINTLSALKEKGLPKSQDTGEPAGEKLPVLSAKFKVNADIEILKTIGCPCLDLKIVCHSDIPARIAGASVHVKGPHILSAVQGGFSTDFGANPNEIELVDEPSWLMGFLPASKPDTPEGFVIERGDMRRFLLPAVDLMLLCFAEAPPDDVYLEVKHLDGRKENLASGLEIQRQVAQLNQMILDRRYQIHPLLVLPMGLTINARQMPDIPTTAFTNDKDFSIPPHPRRDASIDPESDLLRLRSKIFRAGAEMDASSEEWLLRIVREHSDREVRRDAIIALRRLATPRVRDLFLDLLKTEFNEITRELIIRSFELFGTTDDLPLMERMASEETFRFCKESAGHVVKLLHAKSAAEGKDDDPQTEEIVTMAKALEPFPEVRSLGCQRIQELCDDWCSSPQAKECGVSSIQVAADCSSLNPVFFVDAQNYDKGDSLHFPFDRLLEYIIENGCLEEIKKELNQRLRTLRSKVGPRIFQRYSVNRRGFTLALRCPNCTHLLLTNIRFFEGQAIPWTGREACTCPKCKTDIALRPDQLFPVINPGNTTEK